MGQANELGTWILSAMVVLLFLERIHNLMTRVSGRGDRHEVSLLPGVPTKEEFDRHVAINREDHERFDLRIAGVERSGKAAVDAKIEQLRVERKEDMRLVQQEIYIVGHKVAALEKAAELQNQNLASIGNKLDRIAERQ
jgi:hypothetical protein